MLYISSSGAGGLDSIFLGLLNDPAAKFDSQLSNTLQNHLFEVKNSDGSTEAVDLLATNINRGRDHGLPSYNTVRERCGMTKASDFGDLVDVMTKTNVDRLRSVYRQARMNDPHTQLPATTHIFKQFCCCFFSSS